MALVVQSVERPHGDHDPAVLGPRALRSTVMPGASSSATISPRACAPVASSIWTRDIRGVQLTNMPADIVVR
jgi:hypothetical protein